MTSTNCWRFSSTSTLTDAGPPGKHITFGGAPNLNILEFIYRPVLGGDIAIAVDPFAKEIAAGEKEHKKGEKEQRSLQLVLVMVHVLGCTQM